MIKVLKKIYPAVLCSIKTASVTTGLASSSGSVCRYNFYYTCFLQIGFAVSGGFSRNFWAVVALGGFTLV
jgi:hypothetical protein